jgi:hypothetical protein
MSVAFSFSANLLFPTLTPLRIRQQVAVLDALHRLDFDARFFVPGEADVWKDEQRLRAAIDVEGAIEAH